MVMQSGCAAQPGCVIDTSSIMVVQVNKHNKESEPMQTPDDALSDLIGAATREGGAKGAAIGGMIGTCGGALLAGAMFIGVTTTASFTAPALLGAAAAGALVSGIAGVVQGAKSK